MLFNFLKVLVLLALVHNTSRVQANSSLDKNKIIVLKLKIPITSVSSYHKLVAANQIDELVEPKITFDESKSNELYAEWKINKHSNLDNLLVKLTENKIIFEKYVLDLPKRIKRRGVPNDENSRANIFKIRSKDLTLSYYSVNQIFEWMEHLKTEYPNIVELIEIGKSVFNKSMRVIKIGYKNKKKKLNFWFDSGIHAREWTTISTALYTINSILIEQRTNNSVMNKFLRTYDIYFLVILNPDGYEYSQNMDYLWRKNLKSFGLNTFEDECFGVDLNRNFNYHWMKTGASNDTCSDIFAGEKPTSESEASAVQDFILSKKNQWLSYVSLHSYGGFWLHHWEKNNKNLTRSNYIKICHKAKLALNAISKSYKSHKYLFGVPSKLLAYDAAGASDTWAMMVANITYSYTIELGPVQEELVNNDFSFGFHVKEHRIRYIVERAYVGLYEYMRSFVDHKTNINYIKSFEKNCNDDYNHLMKTFNGYWS